MAVHLIHKGKPVDFWHWQQQVGKDMSLPWLLGAEPGWAGTGILCC